MKVVVAYNRLAVRVAMVVEALGVAEEVVQVGGEVTLVAAATEADKEVVVYKHRCQMEQEAAAEAKLVAVMAEDSRAMVVCMEK